MDKITYEQAIELSIQLGIDGYVETMRVYNHAVDIANAETDERQTTETLGEKVLSDYTMLKK